MYHQSSFIGRFSRILVNPKFALLLLLLPMMLATTEQNLNVLFCGLLLVFQECHLPSCWKNTVRPATPAKMPRNIRGSTVGSQHSTSPAPMSKLEFNLFTCQR